MRLTIKYFGMLTEISACQEETLDLPKMTVVSLRAVLYEKYPALENKNFRIAQQNTFVKENAVLTSHEIALLPPFSGG